MRNIRASEGRATFTIQHHGGKGVIGNGPSPKGLAYIYKRACVIIKQKALNRNRNVQRADSATWDILFVSGVVVRVTHLLFV